MKVQRVNYQSYLFLNFDKSELIPSPLNSGWRLENGKCVPQRYSKPALPKDLRESIQGVDEEEMPTSDESDIEDDDYSDIEND